MAKRFIDTEIFNDSWFGDLSVNGKIFFLYLITNCDHAGIIDINLKLVEFQTGIKGLRNSNETVNGQLTNSWETIKQEFGNRLIHLGENYYFLPKFIKYQYPKGLNYKVKMQDSVIKRLKQFNINLEDFYEQFPNCSQTVKVKDKVKVQDKVQVKVNSNNVESEISEDENKQEIPDKPKMQFTENNDFSIPDNLKKIPDFESAFSDYLTLRNQYYKSLGFMQIENMLREISDFENPLGAVRRAITGDASGKPYMQPFDVPKKQSEQRQKTKREIELENLNHLPNLKPAHEAVDRS